LGKIKISFERALILIWNKDFGIDLGKYENISKENLVTLQNTDNGLIP
jgi:hypothetical protein